MLSSRIRLRTVATFTRDISIERSSHELEGGEVTLPAAVRRRNRGRGYQLSQPSPLHRIGLYVRVNPPIWHSFQPWTQLKRHRVNYALGRERLSAAAGTIKLKSHCALLRRRSNQRRSFIVQRNGQQRVHEDGMPLPMGQASSKPLSPRACLLNCATSFLRCPDN